MHPNRIHPVSKYDILETTETGALILNKAPASQETRMWHDKFNLSRLAKCGPICAFCGDYMEEVQEVHLSDEEVTFCDDDYIKYDQDIYQSGYVEVTFRVFLIYCRNCRNFAWNCYKLYPSESDHITKDCVRDSLEATAWSKLASFNADLPEGICQDLAQAIRQDPRRWHEITPGNLERFLSAAFRSTGEYCKVKHVGRPGDGGIDVVLVDASSNKWLVSVKRRETPTKTEPISTLRDILGAMILEGSRHAIIATTAGRFSAPARSAKVTALQKGLRIELMDRNALNRLIENLLPDDAWEESLSGFSEYAVDRIHSKLPSDHQLRLF